MFHSSYTKVPMNPNDSKIAAACHAMKCFGLIDAITEKAVKELLPLYDNSWKFIEEDNFKVLMDVLLPDVQGVTSSNRVAQSYIKTEVELQTQEASRRQHQNDGVLFSDSGLSRAPLKRIRLKSQADGVFLRDAKKVGYKNKEGSAESQPLLKRTSLRGKEKDKISCSSDSEESQPLLKRTCLRDKGKAMIRNSKDYGIDFTDLAHRVKPFKCVCGSPICRGSDFKAHP